ncbi:MAG: PBECR2 nuclease fold domain-containing protein, partial [Thermodesulfobacteriota bacterium]
WSFNPGKAAFGSRLTEAEWAKLKGGKYEPMQPASKTEPVERFRPAPAELADAKSDQEMIDRIKQALGGKAYVLETPGGAVVIDAEFLGRHLQRDGRERFLSFLEPLLEDPDEVFLCPYKNAATGKVVMRRIYLGGFEAEKKRRLLAVAQFQRGCWVGWTVFPVTQKTYHEKQRVGIRLWPWK